MGAVAAEAPRAGETELIFGLVYRAQIRRRRFFPLILGKLGPDHHTQKSHHDRTPPTRRPLRCRYNRHRISSLFTGPHAYHHAEPRADGAAERHAFVAVVGGTAPGY